MCLELRAGIYFRTTAIPYLYSVRGAHSAKSLQTTQGVLALASPVLLDAMVQDPDMKSYQVGFVLLVRGARG